EYIVRVQRGVSSENSWQVIRRYSDFDVLNSSLMRSPCSRSPCSSGWRIRKKYFLIINKEQPKEMNLLSWVDLGPDKFLSDKDLQSAMKLLTSISSYLKKYCNPKKSQGLDLQHIKLYGRQILEGLKLLHDGGLFYGHLHASNVIVDDARCRLMDVENGMLGVPSALRPAFTQLRKINTVESIDVFCFGHLLYEMTYGRPPDSVPVDGYADVPYTAVASVLQSILSTEACKSGMPTVLELIKTPLFSDVQLQHSEKLQIKVPSRLKEALKTAKESLEKRLQEEQRVLHQHRRLTRAQSHHGSEEEKKRRKILARKKSRQSAYENEEDVTVRNNNNSGSGASSPPTCPSSPTPPSTTGALTTPPPPPPLPPAVLDSSSCPPPPLSSSGGAGGGRTALLSSIQAFSKNKLKKSETVDRSKPII
ncbi:hypothetical protein FQN60_009785, partial [Etheostoma spectabile]